MSYDLADARSPGVTRSPEATSVAHDPLLTIDLNLLIPLQALLVEANVTRAAERTGVTQPAMSGSLARLRRHFGDPLLTRNGRGMKLTPFGAALAEPVDRAVDSMRSVLSSRNTLKSGLVSRTFTIVASDYISIVLIKPFLQSLWNSGQNVSVKIIPIGDDMLSPLEGDECDLLIAPRALLSEDRMNYHSRHLFTDRFVAVVDEDNEILDESTAFNDITKLLHVDSLRGAEMPGIELGSALAAIAGSFSARMHLVAGTPMMALVQSRLYELFGREIGLRAIPLKSETSLYQTMYWHRRHAADPEHIWLRDKLSDIARSL
ncbi:DNA-binding transcriptional regulator, LysR family [Lentzea xinjiangensis]|uniref:DNA-binding transcriptional regulator, LysR family n=1 Tax=Lentzea xinjiangensis TaxID=402600 RepID=A0A1H9W0E2_9PSEU|nr:LysR family transcriptional regulator [Lentzea xinjiangensis]SES27284.1 DNA-binding transcriptional regulator, LysR family [Lentzea xinjiangensis]